MTKQSMALIAACTICSTAWADAPAKPKPEAPSELAPLAFFEGNWSCSGKAFASPMGPEHATEANLHVAKAVGGKWLQVAYDEKKTATNATPYHVGVHMGYDAANKRFLMAGVDSMSGVASESSAGWNGDTLVFDGTEIAEGKSMTVRDTFVKKNADEMTHAGATQGDDKHWANTDEETCRRAK